MVTPILVFTTAILLFATGAMILLGASKEHKIQAIAGLVSSIGGAIWATATGVAILFSNKTVMPANAYFICLGSVMAELGLAYFFACPKKRHVTIILSHILLLFSLVVLVLPLFDITLIVSIDSLFYRLFSVLFVLIFIVIFFNLLTHQQMTKKNRLVLLIGWIINVSLSTIFNIIFVFVFDQADFVWVGPVSCILLVLAIYVSLFDSYWLNVSSIWVRRMSYNIIVFAGAMFYFLIAYFSFQIIFATDQLSWANVLYVAIISASLLIIATIVRKATASMRSLLLSDGSIDYSFVMSEISRLNPKSDKTRLAIFLAHHLHVSYIGFIIDKKIYSSKNLNFSEEDVAKFSAALDSPRHDIWLDVELEVRYILAEFNCSDLALLRDDDGNILGQIIVGKPQKSNSRLTFREMNILGMIFKETADMISPSGIKERN